MVCIQHLTSREEMPGAAEAPVTDTPAVKSWKCRVIKSFTHSWNVVFGMKSYPSFPESSTDFIIFRVCEEKKRVAMPCRIDVTESCSLGSSA